MLRHFKRSRATFVAVAATMFLLSATQAYAAHGDCGQPITDGERPAIRDCLWMLRKTLNVNGCEPLCICDVDGNGSATAIDVLICLKHVIGIPIELHCSCPATTTTTTVPATACHHDAASGKCIGTCDEAGTTCVVTVGGDCVCSSRTCGQCYLTVTDTCYLDPCLDGRDCGPNGFCGGVYIHPCDITMECPCCPVCGDGMCDPDENIAPCTCVEDCGGTACTPDPAMCGDYDCDRTIGERRENCPRDCGFCVPCQ